ncbi:glycoside hydrolase family 55 protein [Neobacillus bataviensis]|uniref:glycoside hydrolase family 55 protein n=1 Tax=Neobacillus bataviensis TaxID=220685 RepID=UPI001CBE64E0|nr:glycoside hydrolase family 55 protein [Neobacillus bataviensis]
MLDLSKNYDPNQNAAILASLANNPSMVVQETAALFKQFHQKEFSAPKVVKKRVSLSEMFFRLFSKRSKLSIPPIMNVDSQGMVYPEWIDLLNNEFTKLQNRAIKEVNIIDYGAIGDGLTDCTAAFQKALGMGSVKVMIPKGIYVTKGIRLPSWTILEGAGKGVTTIKLHDDAPKGTRLITNANHWRGNHHLFVGSLSLDWNVERLGDSPKTSTWGNHSSCLTYANVTYGWVKDVEAINPGLHCFDISSTLYNYAGDGFRARGGSMYVWLDHLNGYGFGDDGITTHHSDNIFISNSHMCDPSGRAHQKGFSNSNGIEIDDGSRNVLLVNNSTARCFGGVEIKAHENSSAAANIQIVGHISVNDNRSYNFRHIGHHKSTDAESKTAFNIMAANLLCIAPIFSDLYKDSTPRGLVVSAYKNVVINQFTLIGDPYYDYKGNPVMAIQYRARNVVLKNILIKDFKTAGAGIKVLGGENRAESVRICDVEIENSSPKSIDVGQGIQDIKIENSSTKSVKTYR